MTDRLAPCTTCGHPYDAHVESMTPDRRLDLSIDGAAGCCHLGCGCAVFAGEIFAPQLADANDQQMHVILKLSQAFGFTLMMNWNALPTGQTTGLKMVEMGAAALVRSLAQLLAGASVKVPDHHPQLGDVVEIHAQMLRESFAHAREEVQALEAAALSTASTPEQLQDAIDKAKAAKPEPPKVFVAQPKRVM